MTHQRDLNLSVNQANAARGRPPGAPGRPWQTTRRNPINTTVCSRAPATRTRRSRARSVHRIPAPRAVRRCDEATAPSARLVVSHPRVYLTTQAAAVFALPPRGGMPPRPSTLVAQRFQIREARAHLLLGNRCSPGNRLTIDYTTGAAAFRTRCAVPGGVSQVPRSSRSEPHSSRATTTYDCRALRPRRDGQVNLLGIFRPSKARSPGAARIRTVSGFIGRIHQLRFQPEW